jgi:hypothetical protein
MVTRSIGTVGPAFAHNVDWAQIQKIYPADAPERKYSPPTCTGTKVRVLKGDPDPDRISTSYVERRKPHDADGDAALHAPNQRFQPQGRELGARRLLHFMHYNFARPHQAVKERYPRTPAMAAGVADHLWSLEEIAALLDD